MGWLRQRWKEPGGIAEVLRVAWPLILSNSFWTFQVALDRILLSRYSSAAVGASQSAALLFWTPLALFMFTANYVTTFVAQYQGAGRPERVGPSVWQGIYFSLIAGGLFLGMWFLAPILIGWAGHAPEIQQLEIDYLQCLSCAAPGFLLISAVSGFFAGRGDSRTVMLINFVGVLINAPLTYAWISGEWGFPAWGIAGAGWATVCGTSIAAVFGFLLLMGRRYREEFHTLRGWRWDKALFGRLLYFGLPSGMTSMLEVLCFTLFILLIGQMGEIELAATSIAFTVNLFIYLPAAGIGQGVGIMVGRHLGEDKPDLSAKATYSGVMIAGIFTAVVALAILLGTEGLLWVFQTQEGATDWATIAEMVRILLLFVILYAGFDSLNLIFSFALRGAGDTRFVTIVMLISGWPILVIPTWLAVQYEWGIYWAWVFASAFVVFLGTLCWWRFRQGKWREMRVIEPKGSRGEGEQGRKGEGEKGRKGDEDIGVLSSFSGHPSSLQG